MNQANLLPSAKFAYNNSKSSSTQIIPFIALYSYNPKLRVDIKDTANKGKALAALERIKRLYELRERLRDKLLKSQE